MNGSGDELRAETRTPYFPHGYGGEGFHILTNIRWSQPFGVLIYYLFPVDVWIIARRTPFTSPRRGPRVSPFLFLDLSFSTLFSSFNSPSRKTNPQLLADTDAPDPLSRLPFQLDRALFPLDPRTVVRILNPGSSRPLSLSSLSWPRCFPFVFRHPDFRRETNLPYDPTWSARAFYVSDDPHGIVSRSSARLSGRWDTRASTPGRTIEFRSDDKPISRAGYESPMSCFSLSLSLLATDAVERRNFAACSVELVQRSVTTDE